LHNEYLEELALLLGAQLPDHDGIRIAC
jgi:hypothetical protein